MGIPVYFKTLISDYGDNILHKDKYDDINYLFFDLNCLIHPCARGLSDEEEIINKILNEMDKLILYTGVKDTIYLAIDGIAPKMKMRQQRMRRHKSALERKYNDNQSWNTNAISPGTHFMKKLNISLKNHIQKYKNIILDDSDNRGEGEHKILHYILNNNLEGKICIYGLDADLIQLSLVSHKPNIVLLRETTEYNIENTNSEYIYLKIDDLKNHLLESFNIPKIVDEKRLIDDYIFICFLLGNDFMNHIPSLSLRYGCHNILLDTYSKLQERYDGYFRLIDRSLKDIIHMTFFKEFISELSSLENDMINKTKMIRYKQHKKINSQYYNDFRDLQKFIDETSENKNKNDDKCLSMEDIYRFQYNTTNDKDSVKKMIDNLPILISQNENYNQEYDENECEDYIKCLLWTTHYYFNKCVNWRFNSEYNHGPFIKNLDKFLKNNYDINIKKEDKEYSNIEQLSYIFPKDSHSLHEYDIAGKEYELFVDLSYSRYLWECSIDFI
jgi:5'-3' exonuclease